MCRLRQLSTAHATEAWHAASAEAALTATARLAAREHPAQEGRTPHERPAYHAYCSPPSATAPPFEGESLLWGGDPVVMPVVVRTRCVEQRTNGTGPGVPLLARFPGHDPALRGRVLAVGGNPVVVRARRVVQRTNGRYLFWDLRA